MKLEFLMLPVGERRLYIEQAMEKPVLRQFVGKL
jgi:hypothetical protein